MLVKIQIVFTVATNSFVPDITVSSDAVFLKTKNLLGFSGLAMGVFFFPLAPGDGALIDTGKRAAC